MTQVFKPYSLNLGGRLLEIDQPLVMGIINVTPDSFYSESRFNESQLIARRAGQIIEEGGKIIDLGGYSTRPGAPAVDEKEEMARLRMAIKAVREATGDEAIISVDTFRASVARMAVEEMGANIINDVSGGTLDPLMHNTIAQLRVPYIVMHMRGTPATMQQLTHYDSDVAAEVLTWLAQKIDDLHQLGVNDVIADPGFGFSKTLEQNYRLLSCLDSFHSLEVPLLVGVSRKSMIQRAINCDAAHALNGTTAINTIALMKGAHILRVHDVREAVEACTLVSLTRNQ